MTLTAVRCRPTTHQLTSTPCQACPLSHLHYISPFYPFHDRMVQPPISEHLVIIDHTIFYAHDQETDRQHHSLDHNLIPRTSRRCMYPGLYVPLGSFPVRLLTLARSGYCNRDLHKGDRPGDPDRHLVAMDRARRHPASSPSKPPPPAESCSWGGSNRHFGHNYTCQECWATTYVMHCGNLQPVQRAVMEAEETGRS